MCYNKKKVCEKMRLRLLEYVHENLPRGFSPYWIYQIIVDDDIVGSIILREGTIQERYYDGHIGYHIEEEYRGHHYAYEACLLLKDIIPIDQVIITCDPQNIASLKTIKKLGAEFLETKTIPTSLKKMFSQNEKVKNIYLWKVKGGEL